MRSIQVVAVVLIILTLVVSSAAQSGASRPGPSSLMADSHVDSVVAPTVLPATQGPVANSTPGWVNLTASVGPAPSPRFAPGMVYDAADGYVVLFGGLALTKSGETVLNDTWTFQSGNWTQLNATVHPSGRFGMQMTYDAKDGYVVAFGGANRAHTTGAAVSQSDTWTFKGGAWTQITATAGHPPPPRYFAGFAFDNATGFALLFGGIYSVNKTAITLGDSWRFSAGKWSHLVLTVGKSPAARYGAEMAYDAASSSEILFGGVNGTHGFSDTWSFAKGKWTQLAPALHPPGRYVGSAIYDPVLGEVILFGGQNVTGAYFNDTWAFSGGHWTNLGVAGPPEQELAGFVYDAAASEGVLFGGFEVHAQLSSSTWEFG